MAATRQHYSAKFKRQAVARMNDDPSQIAALANELGLDRSLLYRWRKQYAPPSFSPLPACVGEGAGGEGLGPGGEVISAPADELDDSSPNARLRQSLLDTAFTLTHAIREATENAPLNQLSAALGLVIDRLLKLEAQTSNLSLSVREELIRIEYKDSDGSLHHSPPWARGDPAFEDPVSRGRVRSPFWENRDGQADDSGDGPARG